MKRTATLVTAFFVCVCCWCLFGRVFPQDYVVDPLAEGMWDSMQLLRGPFGKAEVLKVYTWWILCAG